MIFNQSDPRWARHEIIPGDASTRMSRIGCAVTVIAQAGAVLCPEMRCAPDILADRIRARDGFVGSKRNPERKTSIVWSIAAALVGCRVETGSRWLRNTPDISALRAQLARCFANDELAILHLDRDHDGEHFAGDHYGLALYETADSTINVADPAGGAFRSIDSMTLIGASPWGPGREYKVRGLMPIGRTVQ